MENVQQENKELQVNFISFKNSLNKERLQELVFTSQDQQNELSRKIETQEIHYSN